MSVSFNPGGTAKSAERARAETRAIKRDREDRFMEHDLELARMRLTGGVDGGGQGRRAAQAVAGQPVAAAKTPEQLAAEKEVFYSDPKNKYVSGGLMVNGQAVGAPKYSNGYLAFAAEKNRKFNDEQQAKKDALIGDINRLLAAGATMPQQTGSGEVAMGTKSYKVEGPRRLVDMGVGDLTDLTAQMAGQAGAVQAAGKISAREKEEYDRLVDIIKNTPKTITDESGLKEIVNPDHASALDAVKNFKFSGGAAGGAAGGGGGQTLSRGDEYFNKVAPQGQPEIKVTDSRVEDMRQSGVLPPDKMVSSHGGKTVLGKTQGIPGPVAVASGTAVTGPENLVAKPPVIDGHGGNAGNAIQGQVPPSPVIQAQPPRVPPGVQARKGLAPNDPTPIYTSPAQDMMNNAVGTAANFVYDYSPQGMAGRLLAKGWQGVSSTAGRVVDRVKEDAARRRLVVQRSSRYAQNGR